MKTVHLMGWIVAAHAGAGLIFSGLCYAFTQHHKLNTYNLWGTCTITMCGGILP